MESEHRMTYEEAIQKAAKLLRLAGSSNPHEAALAAARAQEIMDRFQIESAAITIADNGHARPDEPIQDFKNDPIDDKAATWKWRLLSAILKANGCKAYMSGGYAVVGRASDVQTVRYFYGWLKSEVDRLCAKECRGNGRTYANNWRIGCAETLAERIKGQQQATRQAVIHEIEEGELDFEGKRLALVRVNSAIAKVEQKEADVSDWMKSNLNLRTRYSSSSYRGDSGARAAGRQAGYSVRMGSAKGSLIT